MSWRERLTAVSRRDLFRGGGWTAALGLASAKRAPASPTLRLGPDIYQSIGVRPLINCKGTLTWVGGSQSLPEVKRAMDEASRHYVHLVELMEAIGWRLAELTGAEWGIVTSGATAALAQAACAAIAGTDPEKIQRIPNLAGLKNEVLMPRSSRNVFDHGMRMVGAKIVEVETREQFLAAIHERTAMIGLLAGPADNGPLRLEEIAGIARERHVPILVDAAAEELGKPNPHLSRGATMVAYSGGKCLRGPQCAGLLLGRKDLMQAAFMNASPHHGFARAMKVGREEMMGALAAVEMWFQRDHGTEWKTWESWLAQISDQVGRIPGVKTQVLQPETLSNRQPRLRVSWDADKMGISGDEVEKALYAGQPRIAMVGTSGGGPSPESSVVVYPYVLMPGEAKIVADRLHEVLSHPPRREREAPAGPPATVAGQWNLHLDFSCGAADHKLFLEQDGEKLIGSERGDVIIGDLRGKVKGCQVSFRSLFSYEGTRLVYEFEGRIEKDRMSGTVILGGAAPREYGKARWVAERHHYVPDPAARPH